MDEITFSYQNAIFICSNKQMVQWPTNNSKETETRNSSFDEAKKGNKTKCSWLMDRRPLMRYTSIRIICYCPQTLDQLKMPVVEVNEDG